MKPLSYACILLIVTTTYRSLLVVPTVTSIQRIRIRRDSNDQSSSRLTARARPSAATSRGRRAYDR